MLLPINPKNINTIKNPVFREYVQSYNDIYEDFQRQIQSYGLPISEKPYLSVHDAQIDKLRQKGLVIANNHKSLSVGFLSPSCETCRKGMNTATFLISVQCPRNCYFCFNPNQQDYKYYLYNKRNLIEELNNHYKKGVVYKDLALTGGEPLMHKDETEAFFQHAKKLYPKAYTRLYTCGAFLDEQFLKKLNKAGLDEIRFSIKMEDTPAEQKAILRKLKLSKSYLPRVLVEMPVLPDNLEQMKNLLLALERIGIDGINLLEFCFPYHNVKDFALRGYRLKQEQYRVLYNYSYAGGLPIGGSEENCLLLLIFAVQNKLKIGVHYCSLENKHTGQIYLQNFPFRHAFKNCLMSQKDYFLKSAKVFGSEVSSIEKLFRKAGLQAYEKEPQLQYLEFPVSYLAILKKEAPTLEVGICYHIVENRDGINVLRELRVDLTTPSQIDLKNDI